jgi:Dihaem cytochrome c
MKTSSRRPARRAAPRWRNLLVIAGAALSAAGARADRVAAAPPLPAYQQECGACHLAYPPALLPAASWRQLMNNLSQHYGTDASLDAATASAISAWLDAFAASGKRARETPPQDRITRAGWFVREHREVAPAVWQRPSIKSAAQCGACHGGAEQGRFDEHDIRIPK